MSARALRTRALLVGACIFFVALGAMGAAVGATGDLIEMEVLGVVPLDSETTSILVLRQKGEHTLLPIFVGRLEGAAIERRMKHGPAEHGHASELLRHSIEALGGRVARVIIEGAGGRPFHARVALDQGRSHHDLEARPSDSVSLALASRAPIFATRQVMTESGLTEQELAKVHRSVNSRSSHEESARASGHVESF